MVMPFIQAECLKDSQPHDTPYDPPRTLNQLEPSASSACPCYAVSCKRAALSS